MKGNTYIAEILQKEYEIKDLTPYEEIDYELQQFSDEISRVKITSKTDRCFCCPVYALFDGYHMSWYGDYGAWVFNCTWKTDVMNLAYNSPYYQLEKLESRDRTEFNEQKCAEQLLKEIKEGDWYTDDLTDEQKKRFDEYIITPYDYICCDDVLYEHEDTCEKLKDLYRATEDEFEWVSAIGNCNFENEDLDTVFNIESYELYNIGKKAPSRFFIILYMLSVVVNMEKERQVDQYAR